MMYMSYPTCRKRMKKFSADSDGERVFYYCPNCADRRTYFPERNAISDDWPKAIFNDAVSAGVLSRQGRVL